MALIVDNLGKVTAVYDSRTGKYSYSGTDPRSYPQQVASWINSYAPQLQQAAQPAPQQRSSGGGGGGGRRYGYRGGGGGYVDPYAAYRKELEAKLNELKAATLPQLDQYLANYNAEIGRIGDQNAQQTAVYGGQIDALMQQLVNQAAAQQTNLSRDLGAQGADARAMLAQAALNRSGLGNVAGNQQALNARLAQIQANAMADRQAMGAAINQSARGVLDAAYMQALNQIRMMGR